MNDSDVQRNAKRIRMDPEDAAMLARFMQAGRFERWVTEDCVWRRRKLTHPDGTVEEVLDLIPLSALWSE